MQSALILDDLAGIAPPGTHLATKEDLWPNGGYQKAH